MYCLGIAASPRPVSNTTLLLERALSAAEAAGARTEKVLLREMKFSPCQACEACSRTGQCVLNDDMQQLYEKIIAADRIILAAPVYSMGMNALGKAMVDRLQRFWAMKYVLQQPVIADKDSRPPRKGFFISCAGTKIKDVFAGAEQVAKYFFRMAEVEYLSPLLFPGIDEPGAVFNHPDIIAVVEKAARMLVGKIPSE